MDNIFKVQQISYKILCDVIKICEENNINYILDYGTLLGAIRHKGFIPWDDDIDISMMRKEYNKFLQIVEDKIGNEYFVQNCQTDPFCLNVNFTKIRYKNSVYEFQGESHINNNKGVGIDIFPFDFIPSSKFIQKIQGGLAGILLWILQKKQKFNYYNLNFLKKHLTIIFSILFRPITTKNIGKVMNWVCSWGNENCKNEGYICDLSIYNLYSFEKGLHKNLIQTKFIDREFNIPENYDKYLKHVYGNYLEIPPVEKRISHNAVKFNFDNFEFKE